jgi:hypothetical protein
VVSAGCPDLFVQVHVPKCAGTTVRQWLLRSHPEAHRSLYLNGPMTIVLDDPNLAAQNIADPALRSYSTHYLRTYEPVRCGRAMRYFTFLRDPIEQFMSYQTYVRREYANITEPITRMCLPPDCADRSSREFADWLLDRTEDYPFRENFQTNYFASIGWRESTGIGPRPSIMYDVWAPQEWDVYRRERLEFAMTALRSFFFVGIVERMDAALEVLYRRFTSAELPVLPLPYVETVNETHEFRDDTSWINESDPVGRRLLAALDDDRRLHAYAASLLDEAVSAG